MAESRRISSRVLIAAATLVVLMVSAEVFAGGCRTSRGYVRISPHINGYHHGPYNYYPSRNYYNSLGYRWRACRTPYLRYRDRYCSPSYYNYNDCYPRRSLYYSTYATFTPAPYITCSRCRSARCDGSCADRGRAVRSAEPPVNVILVTSADREAAKDPAVIAAAWTLLASGSPDEALLEFTKLAAASATSAVPKLGYSLSAAMTDDDYNAQWAMRRALRVDPEGVKTFTPPPALVPRLRELAERYETKASASERTADSRFLAASIYFLLHEYPAAMVNLEPLLAAGDSQRSTATLRELVEARLTGSAETLVQSPAEPTAIASSKSSD